MQACLSNSTVPRAVQLQTIVLYCRRNARFLMHTSPPRKFSECAARFLIRPDDTEPTMPGTIFHQADISAGARRIDLGKSKVQADFSICLMALGGGLLVLKKKTRSQIGHLFDVIISLCYMFPWGTKCF